MKNIFLFLAKLQLHNRRTHRNDTRNCPICYQLIPINTDEEYFFTHVQQCSRKVKAKQKIDVYKFIIFKREQLAANAALAAIANQHRLPPPPTPFVLQTTESTQGRKTKQIFSKNESLVCF